jgi:hypothetical protein
MSGEFRCNEATGRNPTEAHVYRPLIGHLTDGFGGRLLPALSAKMEVGQRSWSSRHVVRSDPYFDDLAVVDPVDGELLGAYGPASRRHAEKVTTVSPGVTKMGRNPGGASTRRCCRSQR